MAYAIEVIRYCIGLPVIILGLVFFRAGEIIANLDLKMTFDPDRVKTDK